MNLQQMNKSVSQRNIEHPASILPSNNLQTPVVHANLALKEEHMFDMRTGSFDNRNITKVGNHTNRSTSSAAKKQGQNSASAQRQKQNPAASSTDYPGMIKGQNLPSQSFDP